MTPSDTAHPEGEVDEAQKLGLPPLPFPACTFADHSYRAYTKAQLIAYAQAAISTPPSRPQGEEGLARHRFWGAGEPDCPKDIKAGNGELHTLRCKVCGLDNPRNDGCGGAGVPDDVARLVVAARIVAHEDQGKGALNELDQASEAFASRVRWDDEPEEPALSNQGKPSS